MLEIAAGHSAGISQEIGDNKYPSFLDDPVCLDGGGAVGTFCDKFDFRLDFMDGFIIDFIFQCSGYQDVNLLFDPGFPWKYLIS